MRSNWFWPSLFAFIVILFVVVGLMRPTAIDRGLDELGRTVRVAFWLFAGVIVALAAIRAWIMLDRHRRAAMRQHDGAYSLQRIKLRNGATVLYDPNLSFSPVTVFHPEHGVAQPQFASETAQLQFRMEVERTRQLQAMYPGDDARMHRYGYASDIPRTPTGGRPALAGGRPALAPPVTVDSTAVTGGEPQPVTAPWRLQDAVYQNTRTKLVMGQSPEYEIVRWDVTTVPHLRVHGMTQNSGKTNLIRCIAANALRSGYHVIVADRRRFKDWQEFKGRAELVDVRDPAAFGAVAHHLARVYGERDDLLARNGAPNIAALREPPQRILLVVAEFGALCAEAAIRRELDGMLHPLGQILREAGATGVHVVIEDQVVDERWPRGISTNAAPVSGVLPQNYGAAGGYHHAHKLPPYTFHFEGSEFRTFDVSAAVPNMLANVPQMTPILPAFDRSVTQETHPLPLVEAQNERRTNERAEPTELQSNVWQWRSEHPDGTQAQMRRDFEAAGITITKSYAHECWHAYACHDESRDKA